MTDKELEEIEARANAATEAGLDLLEGPSAHEPRCAIRSDPSLHAPEHCTCELAPLVVFLQSRDVPALVAEVRRLRGVEVQTCNRCDDLHFAGVEDCVAPKPERVGFILALRPNA